MLKIPKKAQKRWLAPTSIPRPTWPSPLIKPVITHSDNRDKTMLQVKRGSFVGLGTKLSLLSLLCNWQGASLSYWFSVCLVHLHLLEIKGSLFYEWMDEQENGILLKTFIFTVLVLSFLGGSGLPSVSITLWRHTSTESQMPWMWFKWTTLNQAYPELVWA